MSPHIPPEMLSALVDGECGATERREAHEHLQDCEPCRQLIRSYTQVQATLAAMPVMAAPEALVSAVLLPRRRPADLLGAPFRGRRRYVAYAAAAAAALITLGGLAHPVGQEPPPMDALMVRHASVSVQHDVTGQVTFAVTGR